MIKTDDTNTQSWDWELEIACKNKQFLDEVVKAILSYNVINFEVEYVECLSNSDEWDGSYVVLMWSNWFHNLAAITRDLENIEKRLDD